MDSPASSLKPRKQPVQDRSTATVDALHAATIQVLTREGLSRCTTTRVAERAGVSVGSIYQYYPNRDALLAAILERHLNGICVVVEKTCRQQVGRPVATMAEELVSAYLSIKLQHPAESKAIYSIAAERGGPALVARMQAKILDAISAMLESAADARFSRPRVTAAIVLHAMAGPVIALLNGDTPVGYPEELKDQLIHMTSAYLLRSSESEQAA